MNSVLVGRATDPNMDRLALDGMFRLRDTVFHKRLGWDVKSLLGQERDDYDDLNPVYIVSRGSRNRVAGCTRLLPTTGPYMLRDVFPQLLRGEPAPVDPAVWELSRLATAPACDADRRQISFCTASLAIMQRAYDYARNHGIRAYAIVTSVALERLLLKAGLPLQRFGDGESQFVGKVRSVACWVNIDEQCRQAVYQEAACTVYEEKAA